jgi:dihydropteroate synthase
MILISLPCQGLSETGNARRGFFFEAFSDDKGRPLNSLVFKPKEIYRSVLNVTPDSFSDGGHFLETEKAVKHALEMQRAGAALIDIGGESARPGAIGISAEEELRRILPVLRVADAVLRAG